MTRSTKQPAARKQEFVDTARRLFESKGYENTSVDDIVRRMGVAKGLFYYYFGSKEDLLDLIIEKVLRDTVAAMEAVAARSDLDAVAKMRELFSSAAAIREGSRNLTLYFHKESNRHLHADLEARAVRLMAPAMGSIIRQGVSEGAFDTKYPEETALALFAVSSILGHEVYQRPDESFLRRRLEASLYTIERLLGARPGTFDFYKRLALEGPGLKRWLARLKETTARKGISKGGMDGAGGKGDRGGRKRG